MNKRGQNRSFSLCTFFPRNHRGSHVGAMLSFVIFLTFLIFLYSILQPALKTEGDKQDMVDYLTSELRKNFTSELYSVNVIAGNTESGLNCVSITDMSDGLQEQGLDKNYLIIKDESNSILPYFIESDQKTLSIKVNPGVFYPGGFLKIFSSKDIDSSKSLTKSGWDTCYVSSTYTITSVGQMSESFLKKTRVFKAYYELNDESYETIKTQLKVPNNIEFNFELKTVEGESINTTSSKIPPTTANVYVGETPILYVDENASLESGFLTVKVW